MIQRIIYDPALRCYTLRTVSICETRVFSTANISTIARKQDCNFPAKMFNFAKRI